MLSCELGLNELGYIVDRNVTSHSRHLNESGRRRHIVSFPANYLTVVCDLKCFSKL